MEIKGLKLAVSSVFVLFKSINLVSGAISLKTNAPLLKDLDLYVPKLIKNWNQKHLETCDVLFFKIGEKSELSDDIIGKLTDDNAVVLVDPKQCEKLESREGAFIIIESSIFNTVSILKILFSFDSMKQILRKLLSVCCCLVLMSFFGRRRPQSLSLSPVGLY